MAILWASQGGEYLTLYFTPCTYVGTYFVLALARAITTNTDKHQPETNHYNPGQAISALNTYLHNSFIDMCTFIIK